MEWTDYKDKADKMFLEVFDTPKRLIREHHLYEDYVNLLNKRVTWFEVKTANFSRANDWLKHKRHLQMNDK